MKKDQLWLILGMFFAVLSNQAQIAKDDKGVVIYFGVSIFCFICSFINLIGEKNYNKNEQAINEKVEDTEDDEDEEYEDENEIEMLIEGEKIHIVAVDETHVDKGEGWVWVHWTRSVRPQVIKDSEMFQTKEEAIDDAKAYIAKFHESEEQRKNDIMQQAHDTGDSRIIRSTAIELD